MGVLSICVAVIVVLILGWMGFRHLRAKRRIEANSIEPEALYELLKAKQVLLYDVRQPLDFLAHPEIILRAKRIAPKDIAEQTVSFSRDQNSVIYCTGSDHETSHMVLGKARALKFTRVMLLKGGFEAWKAKGYPVEAYTDSFHLDTFQTDASTQATQDKKDAKAKAKPPIKATTGKKTTTSQDAAYALAARKGTAESTKPTPPK